MMFVNIEKGNVNYATSAPFPSELNFTFNLKFMTDIKYLRIEDRQDGGCNLAWYTNNHL